MHPLPYFSTDRPAAQLIVDGWPFLMLAGETHNSSASSLAYMKGVWERVTALHCNTVLLPISWELMEPQEGVFDFSLVDGLLAGARRHSIRLGLLWFGTWKNTYSTYTPAWIKTDTKRFPRAQIEPGVSLGAVTCLSAETRTADARAFAALMRHLREIDGETQTVILVQVENEVGLLGASRDHCPLAEAAFSEPVPARLTAYLQQHEAALHPALENLWHKAGRHTSGGWADVFDSGADEAFMAWHLAEFVGAVAAAGKAEYPLPLFANAWLVQYEGEPPGRYPSGGPVSRMGDLWRCAAPDIAFLAPDIYVPDFADVCAEYHRPGNPLFIPEARRDGSAAAHALYALAEHDALGFAPFGVESIGTDGSHTIEGVAANASFDMQTDSDGTLLAQTYALLSDLLPLIAQAQGTGRMRGILQGEAASEELILEGYRLVVDFGERPPDSPAGGLVICPQPDEFLVAGFGFSVRFLPLPGQSGSVDFLELSEGRYHAGQWTPGRRLNGDEYALRLGETPGVCRARLYRYE